MQRTGLKSGLRPEPLSCQIGPGHKSIVASAARGKERERERLRGREREREIEREREGENDEFKCRDFQE